MPIRPGRFDQRATGAAVPRFSDAALCQDTLPLSARQDVVVFQTPPLQDDVEVTGKVVVKLWASSNAPDTDFTAKLINVYPPSRDFPSGVDPTPGSVFVITAYELGEKVLKVLRRRQKKKP